jgi:rare lipoprotein A
MFIRSYLHSLLPKITETGKASFYADKFNGRKTANGERFSNAKRTAAHKTLPFDTKVKVTNLRNGKSVTVRINDRGPFVAGRSIDLSKKAARKIGMVAEGVANVQMKYKTKSK